MDVRHEDIPEINNDNIIYIILDGDNNMKEVDNGGYNVHPVPPPNSMIIEYINIIKEIIKIIIEILLTLGKTISGDPLKIGIK